jgi:hypothetical protein
MFNSPLRNYLKFPLMIMLKSSGLVNTNYRSKIGARKKAAKNRGFEFLTGRRQTEWTDPLGENPEALGQVSG